MTELIDRIVADNRGGVAAALTSVCSAHPEVLLASLMLARDTGRPIAIEATSNQVNQFGGYTGMSARDFAAFAHGIVDRVGIDREMIVLGGDHLGPQAWKAEDPDIAMAKAATLVRDFVAAGFTKIHLDCSEGCRGEPAQLEDADTARRSAELAAHCREAADDPRKLRFVIGTEVPPPGGARVDETGVVTPTDPSDARKTVDAHRIAFEEAGLGELWPQVCGLVVQPGVEFSPMEVHHLPDKADPGLRAVMLEFDGLALEAHSTDYQRPEAYPRLAQLGFAFLKVGPALTFAWRQALYALDHLRGFLTGGGSVLPNVLEEVMLADPRYWEGHYHGDGVRLARHFGRADRIRYYWPHPKVQAAVAALWQDLETFRFPEPLVEQGFCRPVIERAAALPGAPAKALALASVQEALAPYLFDPEVAA